MWRIETEKQKLEVLEFASQTLWIFGLCLPDLCSFAALPGQRQCQKIVKSTLADMFEIQKGANPTDWKRQAVQI